MSRIERYSVGTSDGTASPLRTTTRMSSGVPTPRSATTRPSVSQIMTMRTLSTASAEIVFVSNAAMSSTGPPIVIWGRSGSSRTQVKVRIWRGLLQTPKCAQMKNVIGQLRKIRDAITCNVRCVELISAGCALDRGKSITSQLVATISVTNMRIRQTRIRP